MRANHQPDAPGDPHTEMNGSGAAAAAAAPPKAALAEHVYQAGFLHGQFADVTLSVARFQEFKLHALIVSTSPTLRHLLHASHGPPYRLLLQSSDPRLTQHGLSIALASLYGQDPVSDRHDADSSALLAAAYLLGLHELTHRTYAQMVERVTALTLPRLLHFCIGDGAPDTLDVDYVGPYPGFTDALLRHLAGFISTTLLLEHEQMFHEVLVHLPYPILKHILESPDLQTKGDMARHQLARSIINEREKLRKQKGGALEEVVVLAFGGGGRGSVEIIQRPAGRGKKLWKAR